MNFLSYRDFSRIFLNFYEFILYLFRFLKNKKIKFLSLAEVIIDATAK